MKSGGLSGRDEETFRLRGPALLTHDPRSLKNRDGLCGVEQGGDSTQFSGLHLSGQMCQPKFCEWQSGAGTGRQFHPVNDFFIHNKEDGCAVQ